MTEQEQTMQERKAIKGIMDKARRDGKNGRFNPAQPQDADYMSRYTAQYNKFAAERVREDGPFAGLTDAQIDRKMQDDIDVEVLVEGEVAGQHDGLPQEDDVQTPVTQEDVTTTIREMLNAPTGQQADAIGDALVARVETQRIAGKASPGTIKAAAGLALQRGAISQEDYKRVCDLSMTLDQAKNRLRFGITRPAVQEEKPQRRAAANGDKRRKSSKNGKGGKAEPKPKPTWEVVALEDDGETVREVLYAAITSAELLQATGVEKDTGKSRKVLADRNGCIVRMTHSVSGKFYTTTSLQARARIKAEAQRKVEGEAEAVKATA